MHSEFKFPECASFVFWGEVTGLQFCFEIYRPLGLVMLLYIMLHFGCLRLKLQNPPSAGRHFHIYLIFYSRIGVAMKKSSALQRCAVHGAATTNGTTECETEVTYNKGRQAVVRMLGKG